MWQKVAIVFGQVIRDVLINGIGGSRLIPGQMRWWVYGLGGLRVRGAWIGPGCTVFGSGLRAASGVWINHRCFLDARAGIDIGSGCSLAMEVMVTTTTHAPGPSTRRAGPCFGRQVHIDEGCWLCARVVVLPGVTIGKGCVIAAGAVVTRDCEPNGLYAGVPARRVRDLL